MLIDCGRCELRELACGDCLVTALPDRGGDSGGAAAAGRRALGAQELRALSVLAAAGLVPPLRFRPAQVTKPETVIVALRTLVRAVIGETGTRLAEAVESA
ncbi:MAG TPA: hypothetical protein VE733_00680 [Streptosporangiaceae bacterium]|jgi:hypothetical protein|nr:hypothetical protein [Streptosporangiaceae bacterium]